jgi:hypothetical protein
MYSFLDNSYQKIYIISDTPVSANRLKVYHQNILLGEFTNPSVPTTGAFSKDLIFAPTSTSLGLKYIFTITPEDIGMDTYFDDFLYHFELFSADEKINPLFGLIVDRQINCCIAKKIAETIKECDGCKDTKSLAEINTIHAYLTGAKAAIRMEDVSTALCALQIIENICLSCGCNG